MSEPTAEDLEAVEVISDNELFVQVPLWVLWHDELSSGAVRMYGTLTSYAGRSKAVWPSLSTLAEHTNISTKTANRHLDELISVGAITRKRRKRTDGVKTSNLYVVHWRETHQSMQDDYSPDTTAASAALAKKRARQSAETPVTDDEEPPTVDDSEAPHPDHKTQPRTPVRHDVEELMTYLADTIEARGQFSRPKGSKSDHAQMRHMLDIDGRTPDQIRTAIDWATDHPFWAQNVRSARKLREHYESMRFQATQEKNGRGRATDRGADILRAEMERAIQHDAQTQPAPDVDPMPMLDMMRNLPNH